MAVIEVEIKDEKKVDFIKQLLKEYGLSEVDTNIFVDKKKSNKITQKTSKTKDNI
jgi:phenylalanyl-tRNA synthetase beta subunit